MEKPKKYESSEHSVAPFWKQNWTDLDRVFDNFRREFERTISSFPALNLPSMSMASMSCDVLDEGDRYVIHAEMPGVEKKDVKLNALDNSIEISAEHKEESEEKKKDYLRKERKAVSYYRRLPLPEKVDSSKAAAKLNNGVLTVDIPKVTPTPKSKSKDIPVQ
jgi:HSP20 family protein